MYLGKSPCIIHPKYPGSRCKTSLTRLPMCAFKLKHHLAFFVVHQSTHEVGDCFSSCKNSPNDSMSRELAPTVSPRLSRTVLSL